jgi:hypothetical protein
MTMRSDMTTRRIAAATGAVIAALAIGGTASADNSKDTKIVLNATAPTFNGTIESTSKLCLEGRKVKLMRITKGRDEVLGRGRTLTDGIWGIPYEPKRGNTYYAKVKRQSMSNGVFCAGDRSNRVKV